MPERVGRRHLLAAGAVFMAAGLLTGCSNMPGPAKTERERRINVGADPSTLQGKRAASMMDSGLVPAPSGVKTGFQGGMQQGRPSGP